MKKFFKIASVSLLLLATTLSFTVNANEVVSSNAPDYLKAKVLEIVEERDQILYGTDNTFLVQVVRVEVSSDGEQKGRIIEFENDFVRLKEGDKIFLNHYVDINNIESFSVKDIDRSGPLLLLILVFVISIIVFAGRQGIRSLISLLGSIAIIAFILIPAILNGYNPTFVSVIIASLVLFFAVFFTHGFNRESVVAFGGTVIAVIVTGILAYASVYLTRLTGFASDESVYLNLNTGGNIDFRGLLLGAILIGVLGVLDDIAITQASVVSELKSVKDNLSNKEIYRKAIRVGRDHIGALVNTLALAYVGTSLPLILLFASANSDIWINLNSEIFATEIVRTLVGSIGLVLTVPITTLLAVHFLKGGEGHSSHSHAGHSH